MGGTAKANALRSAVVVVGALAFGYLTLQLGFKPYLMKAELEQQRREAESAAASQSQDSFNDSFSTEGAALSDGLSTEGAALSDGLPESDHKL